MPIREGINIRALMIFMVVITRPTLGPKMRRALLAAKNGIITVDERKSSDKEIAHILRLQSALYVKRIDSIRKGRITFFRWKLTKQGQAALRKIKTRQTRQALENYEDLPFEPIPKRRDYVGLKKKPRRQKLRLW